MEGAAYFADCYDEARERFRNAVDACGAAARRWSTLFEEEDAQNRRYCGRHGEELATDFAWFGAEDAPRVLVVCSGTHGVEGLPGSGAQLALVKELIPEIASDALAVFLIHGINPWGCSHERRCDHAGIDIMRNFWDFAEEPPIASELLRRYIWALSPSAVGGPRRWLEDFGVYWAVLRYGLSRLQAEVPQGQYEFPHAPFYGGRGPSWSRLMLGRELMAHVGRDRAAVAIIDIHTGLGRRGAGVMLGEHETFDEPSCVLAQQWWGKLYEPEGPEQQTPPRFARRSRRRTAYRLNGSMSRGVRHDLFGDDRLVYGVHEFGTVPRLRSLNAVRSDHAVWNAALTQGEMHPDPDAPDTKQAHKEMRAAFYPDDPNWRAGVASQSVTAARLAAEGLLNVIV